MASRRLQATAPAFTPRSSKSTQGLTRQTSRPQRGRTSVEGSARIVRSPQRGLPKEQRESVKSLQIQETVSRPKPQLIIEDEEEAQWINGLLNFLYEEILPLATSDPNVRILLVSEISVFFWRAVFTHRSYNPNNDENYEVLEKLGDPIMKAAFYWYVKQKYRDQEIQERELGRWSDFYLAKDFQADLTEKYGLRPWIRTRVDLNKHTREDVLEALIGGLFMVADKLLPKAYMPSSNQRISPAFTLCYNLVASMFSKVELDFKLFLGQPKNQVKEIFEKMRWGEFGKVFATKQVGTSGPYIVTLTFTEEFNKWLDNENRERAMRREPPIIIEDQVFAQGISYDKKIADKKAFLQGLKALEDLGITWDWAHSQKAAQPIANEELARLDPLVMLKLKQNGLVIYEFPKQRKSIGIQFIQLVGIDPTGRKHVLATIEAVYEKKEGPKLDDLKIAAMKAYLLYGADPQVYLYEEIPQGDIFE